MLRKSILCVALLVIVLETTAAQTILDECGQCQPENCPSTSNCLAGGYRDKCGCCVVCGRLEGEKCDNYTLPLPQKDQYGFCGDQMVCLLRKDLEKTEVPEALCVCENESPVCGSDGRTYSSMCKLRQEANLRNVDLSVAEWGPCESAPVITSGPEDVTGNLHEAAIALGCEARGFPIPVLMWEFESATGKKIKLPGDDQMIALQVRGGPETLMVSSWIQILKLRPTDAGTYTCIVLNKKGVARASATVTVETESSRNPPESRVAEPGAKQVTKVPSAAKKTKTARANRT